MLERYTASTTLRWCPLSRLKYYLPSELRMQFVLGASRRLQHSVRCLTCLLVLTLLDGPAPDHCRLAAILTALHRFRKITNADKQMRLPLFQEPHGRGAEPESLPNCRAGSAVAVASSR